MWLLWWFVPYVYFVSSLFIIRIIHCTWPHNWHKPTRAKQLINFEVSMCSVNRHPSRSISAECYTELSLKISSVLLSLSELIKGETTVQSGLAVISVYPWISWSVQHYRFVCVYFISAYNNRPGKDRPENRKRLYRKDGIFLNLPHFGNKCFCSTDIASVLS